VTWRCLTGRCCVIGREEASDPLYEPASGDSRSREGAKESASLLVHKDERLWLNDCSSLVGEARL